MGHLVFPALIPVEEVGDWEELLEDSKRGATSPRGDTAAGIDCLGIRCRSGGNRGMLHGRTEKLVKLMVDSSVLTEFQIHCLIVEVGIYLK